VSSLFQDVKISEATLNKAFEHQAVLSINQCEVKRTDVTDKNNNVSFEGLDIHYH
jgi:hypothetical protein